MEVNLTTSLKQKKVLFSYLSYSLLFPPRPCFYILYVSSESVRWFKIHAKESLCSKFSGGIDENLEARSSWALPLPLTFEAVCKVWQQGSHCTNCWQFFPFVLLNTMLNTLSFVCVFNVCLFTPVFLFFFHFMVEIQWGILGNTLLILIQNEMWSSIPLACMCIKYEATASSRLA